MAEARNDAYSMTFIRQLIELNEDLKKLLIGLTEGTCNLTQRCT